MILRVFPPYPTSLKTHRDKFCMRRFFSVWRTICLTCMRKVTGCISSRGKKKQKPKTLPCNLFSHQVLPETTLFKEVHCSETVLENLKNPRIFLSVFLFTVKHAQDRRGGGRCCWCFMQDMLLSCPCCSLLDNNALTAIWPLDIYLN